MPVRTMSRRRAECNRGRSGRCRSASAHRAAPCGTACSGTGRGDHSHPPLPAEVLRNGVRLLEQTWVGTGRLGSSSLHRAGCVLPRCAALRGTALRCIAIALRRPASHCSAVPRHGRRRTFQTPHAAAGAAGRGWAGHSLMGVAKRRRPPRGALWEV